MKHLLLHIAFLASSIVAAGQDNIIPTPIVREVLSDSRERGAQLGTREDFDSFLLALTGADALVADYPTATRFVLIRSTSKFLCVGEICPSWLFLVEQKKATLLLYGLGLSFLPTDNKAKGYVKGYRPIATFEQKAGTRTILLRSIWEWKGSAYALKDKVEVDNTLYLKAQESHVQFLKASLSPPEAEEYLREDNWFWKLPTAPTPIPTPTATVPPTPRPTRTPRGYRAPTPTAIPSPTPRTPSFDATFSCEIYGRAVALVLCVYHSSIKIQADNNVELYDMVRLARSGQSNELRVTLPEHFQIQARNGADTEGLILTLRITDQDGKKVFEDKATQGEPIAVRN